MRNFVMLVAACGLGIMLADRSRGGNSAASKNRVDGVQPLASASTPQDAKTLYTRHCAVCHGETGKGDGPAAEFLFPKPRGFTEERYRVRTTATGEMPTDEDLLGAIANGLPGSAMPSFAHLAEKDRRQLLDFVKSLAVVEIAGERKNLFELRGKPRKIDLPPAPKPTGELLARGKKLYFEQGCNQCHGDEGLGDGPSALSLKDDKDFPSRPNNFQRGIYKGGGEVPDIYMRFTTGMTGTPMPSYEESLKGEDRWALAYYVKSVAGPKVARQSGESTMTVRKVSGDFPLHPDAAVYREGAPAELPLMLLSQRNEAVESVSVHAVHNGRELAILMEWEDTTVDGAWLLPESFGDGAAVQFPLQDSPPDFAMGTKQAPVNIWHWRLDRQVNLARSQDFSRFQAFEGAIQVMGTHDDVRAAVDYLRTPTQNLVARQFGTLELLPLAQQTVSGRGLWREGHWHVVFIRALTTGADSEPQFKPGQTTHAAFAIWDGAHGDRAGQKMVTYWQKFALEK